MKPISFDHHHSTLDSKHIKCKQISIEISMLSYSHGQFNTMKPGYNNITVFDLKDVTMLLLL